MGPFRVSHSQRASNNNNNKKKNIKPDVKGRCDVQYSYIVRRPRCYRCKLVCFILPVVRDESSGDDCFHFAGTRYMYLTRVPRYFHTSVHTCLPSPEVPTTHVVIKGRSSDWVPFRLTVRAARLPFFPCIFMLHLRLQKKSEIGILLIITERRPFISTTHSSRTCHCSRSRSRSCPL